MASPVEAPFSAAGASGSRLRREALGAAVVAGVVTAIVIQVAPPGTDLAAHLYQRSFFLQHGFSLWNNFWYAGRYEFVTYSLLYYPLAALVGLDPVSIGSIALAAFAFTLLVGRQWGPTVRWSSRSFALAWPGVLLTGTLPFALGVAFGLTGLVALQRRRYRLAAVLGVLALGASPLALLLIGLPLVSVVAAHRTDWRRFAQPVAIVLAGVLAEVVLWRLFPATGREPFWFGGFIGSFTFASIGAVLTWRDERTRILRWLFVLYGAVSLLAFVVPTELGGSIARVRLMAIPLGLLILPMRRWRPLPGCLLAMGLAIFWNISALTTAYAGAATDPGSRPSFWHPAISFIHGHLAPGFRVEVVDTAGHWPAMYFPQAGIPLVRGWFRQDDFPQNKLLYHPLAAPDYLNWLHGLGVQYVVLSDAPPDFSAEGEASLLASGRSALPVALRTADLTVYAVPDAVPIVTGPGPATVSRLTSSGLAVNLPTAGTYRVAVRWSPYWRTTAGCVEPGPDGMIVLAANRAGPVELAFHVDPSSALHAFTGSATPACAVGMAAP